MLPQDKWKLISTREEDVKTKTTNKKTYHWFPHETMWNYHKLEACDMVNTGKENTTDYKYK